MARRYAIAGDQAATADDTIVALESSASVRPVLYQLTFGCYDTPADNAFQMQLSRTTTTGVRTTVTPVALDPNHGIAAVAGGASNHSTEPTYTASTILLDFSINAKNTYQWVQDPEFGIVGASTANNGLGLRFVAVSGGTQTCSAVLHHEE